ncbi:MAG: hypothetical protein L0Z62_22510 [Gemmataceae bacterium]|nr:hypothetical protein [Gemmataceae bacterium]
MVANDSTAPDVRVTPTAGALTRGDNRTGTVTGTDSGLIDTPGAGPSSGVFTATASDGTGGAATALVVETIAPAVVDGATPLTPATAGSAPSAHVPSTVGVFDPATGTWYLRNANSPGAPDIEPFAYGAPGWLPVGGVWASSVRPLRGRRAAGSWAPRCPPARRGAARGRLRGPDSAGTKRHLS